MLVVMVNFKKQLLSLSFWLTTHFNDFYSHGELNSKCDVLSDSVLTEVFVVNRIKRVRKTNFSFAMREKMASTHFCCKTKQIGPKVASHHHDDDVMTLSCIPNVSVQ